MQGKWTPPDIGWHKLNIDASIQERQSGFQVGMILRNERGDFVSGMTKVISGFASTIEAEATGVWKALSWIQTSGLQQIYVETDSLLVANALRHDVAYQLEVGTVLS